MLRSTFASTPLLPFALVSLLALGGCAEDFEYNGSFFPSSGIPNQDEVRPLDGDALLAPPTNPFVMADADPLSTFAVDVDTASYDIFRQHVNSGDLPSTQLVRLEEYVNAFDYEYMAPDAEDGFGHPFALDVESAPSPFNDTTLLRVGIRGQDFADMAKGSAPANITWLVDVSGSMSNPFKLGLVKTFATEALKALPEGSNMSIVTYAGSTRVALPSTSDKAVIQSAFSSLSAGGSTAGGAGITLAYQQAQAGFVEGGTNVVILCSDGDFNVGLSSTDALVELIKEKRKTGIMLSVYGFGMSNLNDSMFELVSNAGNGTYAVISDEDQAIDYAHHNLLQNINYVAQDVKVQVAFNEDLVAAYRLLGYENRAIADEDFKNDVIDAGEIGADHRVTALYELVLTNGTIPTPAGAPAVQTTPESKVAALELEPAPAGSLVQVRLRYKQVGASQDDAAQQVDYTLMPAIVGASFEGASSDFQWAVAVAGWAEILKASPFAPAAQTELIRSIVDANVGQAGDRNEFKGLLEKALALLP